MEPELAAALSWRYLPWLGVALVPVGVVALTSLGKVLVVLLALRTGLGAERILPYPALLGLGGLVAAGIMAPVVAESWAALGGMGRLEEVVMAPEGFAEAGRPWLEFWEAQAKPRDLEFLVELRGAATVGSLDLATAFVLGELREALRMTVMILLPFVVVDLLAAQVLAVGNLAPAILPSLVLPAKILLFLGAGGWEAVLRGLAASYQ